jgi:hypothetical protein
MKHIATVALMLNLGVAGIYAEQKHVNMTFSGTVEPSPINLQPGTNTDEVNLAGSGAPGQFTYRELHADTASPQSSSTCTGPTHLFFATVAGGGVFRFQDGSLLTVRVTGGSVCIDFTAGSAHVPETYQITGGTGRFKGASGTLTGTATWTPVVLDAAGNPQLLTSTGEFDGMVFGVAKGQDGQD